MDIEVTAHEKDIRGRGCEGEGGQMALNRSPEGGVIGWDIDRYEMACGGSCHGQCYMYNIPREGWGGRMLCYQGTEGLQVPPSQVVDSKEDPARAPCRRDVLVQVKGWGGAAQVRLIGEEDLPEGVLVPAL